jgi:hypothetical protein
VKKKKEPAAFLFRRVSEKKVKCVWRLAFQGHKKSKHFDKKKEERARTWFFSAAVAGPRRWDGAAA